MAPTTGVSRFGWSSRMGKRGAFAPLIRWDVWRHEQRKRRHVRLESVAGWPRRAVHGIPVAIDGLMREALEADAECGREEEANGC